MKSKTFFCRVEGGDILAEIARMTMEQRGEWITQFAIDIVGGVEDRAVTDYGKRVISEASKYSESRRTIANKRWHPHALHTDAHALHTDAHALLCNGSNSNSNKNNKETSPETYDVVEKAIIEIVGHLNEKTGKKFSTKTKPTRDAIRARLAEGWTVEDFKKAIDNQCREWLRTDMEVYLSPDTLFRPSKFEKYVCNVKHEADASKDSLKGTRYDYSV